MKDFTLSPKGILVVLASVFYCGLCAVRDKVIIQGTTVGPNYLRLASEGSDHCPSTHPWAFNSGKSCCSHFNRQEDPEEMLHFLDELSRCHPAAVISCPDEKNGCRRNEEAVEHTVCPLEYPFPLGSGFYCCGSRYRLSDDTGSQKCDGDVIQLNDPIDCCPPAARQACSSGTKKCSSHPEPSNLLITGGQSGEIQVIDLVSSTTSCPPLPPFDKFSPGPIVSVVQGRPRLCSMTSGSEAMCYTYNQSVPDVWQPVALLEHVKVNAEVVELGWNKYWIAGGGGWGNPATTTSVILDNGVSTPGPALPMPMTFHCLVRVNGTHAFAGGFLTYDVAAGVDSMSNAAFLVDLRTFEWTQLPPMTEPRACTACGVVSDGFGDVNVVVAGGFLTTAYDAQSDRTEIFSLRDWQWEDGPNYPHKMQCPSNTQFGDHFVATGGYTSGVYYDTVVKMDISKQWQVLDQTLNPARDNHVALAIYIDMANCV